MRAVADLRDEKVLRNQVELLAKQAQSEVLLIVTESAALPNVALEELIINELQIIRNQDCRRNLAVFTAVKN